MKRFRSLVPIALLAVLVLPAGCHEDESTQPSGTPQLVRMWPNEDGRFWNHDATGWTWVISNTENLSPEPVPLPSVGELAALADERLLPKEAQVRTGTYRLEFADSITTESGVRRQNLVETLTFDALGLISGSRGGTAFLRQLAIARPDLRARIAAMTGSEPVVAGDFLSLILHGGAWEKTDDWIGSYGDLDQRLSWKYLDRDLTTGHEFVHQLVPALAEDVFLRARVLGPATVETPAGVYTNAIEVFYVIDYGVSSATSETGEHLGYIHFIGYGSVHYAAGVGPVASFERVLSSYGPQGLGMGAGELRFLLRSSGLTS